MTPSDSIAGGSRTGRKRFRLRMIVLACILLLVGVPLISSGCADQLVLPSNHDVVDPGKAQRRMLGVNGRKVECWSIRSPGAGNAEPSAFVLFFVGKGDRVDRWIGAVAAGSWASRPVEVWGMNYPGAGGSDGPPRLAEVGPDAIATYDALRQVAGSRPIFIHGGSFGTTAALCVAAHRPVDGLIIQNPPPLRQLILGNYGWWNLWLAAGPVAMQIPDNLDSIANAKAAKSPAIFVSAGADRVIPPRYHRMVIDAYAGPKRVVEMPGAGHDDPLTHEAAEQVSAGIEWMWNSTVGHKESSQSPQMHTDSTR
jgi:pimeloyl-ACP methyl ester carboxylesterase